MLRIFVSAALLLLATLLQGAALQKEYTLYDTSVYSTDLVPDCEKKFFVLHLPANQQKYQHPVHEIQRLFKQFHCPLEEAEFARVTFHLQSRGECLEKELRSHFMQKYPTLKIDSLFVKKNRYFDCNKPYDLLSDPARPTGTIRVRQGEKTHFFRYDITGSFKRFVTVRKIARGEELTRSNIKQEAIEFDHVDKNYVDSYRNKVAKYALREGKVLTTYMVKEKPAVRRDHTVKCRYLNGNIVIEFEARALDDGVVGEVIKVQNGQNRYKAKIIAPDVVEIL